MALVVARAVESPRLFPSYFLMWRYENKLVLVGRLGVDLKSFFAHGHARATLQRVAVIVHDSFPRTAVNHRLITLDARSFFALVGGNGDSAKLDALDNLVR